MSPEFSAALREPPDDFLQGLGRLIGPAPVHGDVNGIPGYSAFWVNSLYEYYLHSGSIGELDRVHARLVQLLDYITQTLHNGPLSWHHSAAITGRRSDFLARDHVHNL